jgi:hypothetical protein
MQESDFDDCLRRYDRLVTLRRSGWKMLMFIRKSEGCNMLCLSPCPGEHSLLALLAPVIAMCLALPAMFVAARLMAVHDQKVLGILVLVVMSAACLALLLHVAPRAEARAAWTAHRANVESRIHEGRVLESACRALLKDLERLRWLGREPVLEYLFPKMAGRQRELILAIQRSNLRFRASRADGAERAACDELIVRQTRLIDHLEGIIARFRAEERARAAWFEACDEALHAALVAIGGGRAGAFDLPHLQKMEELAFRAIRDIHAFASRKRSGPDIRHFEVADEASPSMRPEADSLPAGDPDLGDCEKGLEEAAALIIPLETKHLEGSGGFIEATHRFVNRFTSFLTCVHAFKDVRRSDAPPS